MSAKQLRGGYFYPLDVRAALDPVRHRAYLRACVRRALLEPKSARRMEGERALRALRRSRAEGRARAP